MPTLTLFRYESHHSVRISDKALLAAATLSERYIPDRFLPDKVWNSEPDLSNPSSLHHSNPSLTASLGHSCVKAIDLIDEATARAKMEKTLKPEVWGLVRGGPFLQDVVTNLSRL